MPTVCGHFNFIKIQVDSVTFVFSLYNKILTLYNEKIFLDVLLCTLAECSGILF